MDRLLDLIVYAGHNGFHFGLCCQFDWIARRSVDVTPERSLYEEVTSFLLTAADLFDRIGKIVLVTDIAARFPEVLAEDPKRIGYIRIAPDQYTPEYMMKLVSEAGGELLVENIRPGAILSQADAAGAAGKFLAAGISDIVILSTFQIEHTHERQMIRDLLSRAAPDSFSFHTLEAPEYESFLLLENRLLAGVCLKDSLSRETRQVESACRNLGIDSPVFLLSGEGYCMDLATALRDPLRCWQADHAAVLIGASRLFGLPDAVAASSREDHIVIDRIKDHHPVAMGRTKQFFGLQVSGPLTGAVEFGRTRYRQRVIDAIGAVNTEPGPLPIIDITGGILDDLELEAQRFALDSRTSALITGAQCAPFRMDFYGTAPASGTDELLRSSLREEAARWLESSGIRLRTVTEEYMNLKTRYRKEGQLRMRLRVTGGLR